MIEIFVDGGARGNPGPSGGGFAIYQNGRLVKKGSEFFGVCTNNQAEYLALKSALRAVSALFPGQSIFCRMDSQLVVEQMSGNFKVKSPNVKPIYQEARQIADKFKSFVIEYIPREANYLADKLANQAMDHGIREHRDG